MTGRPYHLFLLFALSLSTSASVLAGNWPQWRGPAGTSVSDETSLPLKWDGKTGVLWQCAMPDNGASTPAIWGNAVFLTVHHDDKLLLLKVNKDDGKIEWTREVGKGTIQFRSPKRPQSGFHKLHNMASPSPVTDGQFVIVHFGNGDLAAYDFAGKRLWLRNLQKDHGEYSIWWGHANSPILWKNLVISVCMQDSLTDLQKEPAPSYVVAHDKKTGEQKWKTMRMTGATKEWCDSYTTPLIHHAADHDELIVMGGNHLDAYDPATGKQLWVFAGFNGNRVITGPTLGDGLVYATTGMRKELYAVRLGGKGKLSEKDVVWQTKDSTPDTPCPVVYKGLMFLVSDNGVVQCLDAKTGDLKWKERLKGDFKASPIAGDGKVYFLNLAGTCTVVSASGKFEVLAENAIDDEIVASMAVADGRIYIRGKKSLYCIGGKK
jgi:outer membrane protein assembly factor BamB